MTLELTPEEQAWIADHPVIRVAATPDWPPFEFLDSGGVYRGITAELLERYAAIAGLTLEPITGDWPTLDEGLRTGSIDVCPGLQATEARAAYLLFSHPVLSFPHAIYTRRDGLTVEGMDDLKGRRVAVEEAYYLHAHLQEVFPEIELVVVPNALEALLSVSRGTADAYVGNVAVSAYLIENNVLPDIEMGPYADLGPLELSIGIQEGHAPLQTILNKAIETLPISEKRAIIDRYVSTQEAVTLSAEEREWIRMHPVIRLGIDPEFAPFEFVGSDGQYLGMASDYVRLLNERLGINMQVVHKDSWAEAMALGRQRELDGFPCLGKSAERETFLNFSRPYLSFHRVIITRLDTPFFGGIDDLRGLRASVQRDSSHHNFVTTKTSMEPVLYDSFGESLAAVARGETDCAVGNAATTAYWLKVMGLSNLRLAVPTGEGTNELYFGIRKDWPELVEILNKGLNTLTDKEILDIRSKWIDVEVKSGIDIRRVAELITGIIAIFLLLLLLVIVHNRRLRREISARLEIAAALRESEEDYRTLVQSANSIILRMSPAGKVLFLNRYGEQFFGFQLEDIVGLDIVGTIVPPTDSRGRDLVEAMDALGQAPETYAVHENENMTSDGRRVWIAWTNCPLYHSDGTLEEILCVGNDVTAQRRVADTLRRYEFIVNTVKSMMSVVDSTGIYEAVNDAWCAATGVAREDAVGKQVAAVWGEKVAEHHIQPNLNRCFAGEQVFYEATLALPVIGERICEVTMYPFSGTSDYRARAVIVAQDITERKAAEQQLKDAMVAAEAGNRAKSAFLANMSHEIRTPMNAVLGYTQLLQRSPSLAPEQKHALDAIRSSGDHLLGLINDILELSRVEAGHVPLEPVSFTLLSLCNDLEMMFRVKTDSKGLDLRFEIDGAAPRLLRGDLNRIRQVLINLIGNAVKFTERGGITVRVRQEPCELDGGGGARLPMRFDVEDTGCGIPENVLESVFGSFEQAEHPGPRQEGAGLGLTISRNFARLMEGDVTVRSSPGAGSCFSFSALLEPGRESELPKESSPRAVKCLAEGAPPCRVLVIDDRDTNRDILCRMLTPLGFEVREACNGQEGLDEFRAWSPRVVLIDLVMPVMNGWDAIRAIRALNAEGPPVCIIAITASTLIGEKEAVLAAGADMFLHKPFREETLLEAIGKHTGLEFTFDDGGSEVQDDRQIPIDAARAAMARLPEALSEELRLIVTRGAVGEASALVPRLREHDGDLSRLVAHCADGYVLDRLTTLWEPELKT